MPELSTDAQGRIELGIRDRNRFCIAAHAPGFASAVVVLTKDQTSNTLDITLAPANPIHLHIVDAVGAPIPNATFAVDYWLNEKARFAARDFRVSRISDPHGDITWTEAPDKTVSVLLFAPGCMGKRIALAPGSTSTVTLFPQPIVRVHGVSASTGQPLTDFRVVEGVTDRTRKNVQWWDDPESLTLTRTLPDGSLEFTDALPQTGLAVRAAGAHYLPSNSPILPVDGHDYDVTLPLHEAPPLTGQAIDADGNPVPNLTFTLRDSWYDIYQLPLAFTPDDAHHNPAHFATTDKDGTFSFPPRTDHCLLAGSNDNGYVLAIGKESENDLALPFHPWATVRGTVLRNKAPALAGISVSLDGPGKTDFELNMTFGPGCHLSTTTDAAGHFEFAKVFAGEFTCHVDASSTQAASPDKNVKPRPGQTSTLTLTAP